MLRDLKDTFVDIVVVQETKRVFRGRFPGRGEDGGEINPHRTGERLVMTVRDLGLGVLDGAGFVELPELGEALRIKTVQHHEAPGPVGEE